MGPGSLSGWRRFRTPEPRPNEVRIKVRAAGMCHTDLHFESGVLDLRVAPLTMGHEIAGVVDRVGEGVDPAREGERVVVYYYSGCGSCEWCSRGLENLCDDLEAEYGFVSDGGYAEYMVVPARNAVFLPEGIGFEEAAPIGCGVTTALHACSVADLKAGEVAVVYGVGTVGYGLIQVARLRGAEVIGVGRTAEKLRRASDLGADVIDATAVVDVAASVRERDRGTGDRRRLRARWHRRTMTPAMGMLAKRGRLVFIGYSEDTFSVQPIERVINETVVTASVGNTLNELREAIRLVEQGRVRTFVDRTLPLEKWEEGLGRLREGRATGRIVLEPSPRSDGFGHLWRARIRFVGGSDPFA